MLPTRVISFLLHLERVLEQEHITDEIHNITQSFSREVYAVLLGDNLDGGREIIIDTLVPIMEGTENNLPITPEAVSRKLSRQTRDRMIGVFHNHPNGPPIPSSNDIRHVLLLEEMLSGFPKGGLERRHLIMLISSGISREVLCFQPGEDGKSFRPVPRYTI